MISSDDESESAGKELLSLQEELSLQLNLQGIRDELPNINKRISTAKRKLNGLGRSNVGSSTPRVVNWRITPERVAFWESTHQRLIDLCTGFIDPSESPPVRVKRACRPVVQAEDAELFYLKPSSSKRSLSTALDNANTSVVEKSYGCPLCLSSVHQREPCATRCGHIFCKECIETAARLKPKCPLCKEQISISELLRIYL